MVVLRSGEVEPVGVHDLDPGVGEVRDELLPGVVAGVDLGEGPQLGVGPNTRSTAVAVRTSPLARSRIS